MRGVATVSAPAHGLAQHWGTPPPLAGRGSLSPLLAPAAVLTGRRVASWHPTSATGHRPLTATSPKSLPRARWTSRRTPVCTLHGPEGRRLGLRVGRVSGPLGASRWGMLAAIHGAPASSVRYNRGSASRLGPLLAVLTVIHPASATTQTMPHRPGGRRRSCQRARGAVLVEGPSTESHARPAPRCGWGQAGR